MAKYIVDGNEKRLVKGFKGNFVESVSEPHVTVKVCGRNYSKMDKEDLIEVIKQLKSHKKFGLVWEEKEQEIVVSKSKTHYPVLCEIKDKYINLNENEDMNLIIEGDNYDALRALYYPYFERVNVIYIDPPYNNGKKSWKYNNNYVDSNDQWRHSKFVAWINNRLKIARDLLSDDGIIIMAIDDWEIATMRLLMDEIFDERNRIGTIIVKSNPAGRTINSSISPEHEYMLIYAKDKINVKLKEVLADTNYPFEDSISIYDTDHYLRTGGWGKSDKYINDPNYYYPIYYDIKTNSVSTIKNSITDIEILPLDAQGNKRVWRWTKKTFDEKCKTEIVVKRVNSGRYTIDAKKRPKGGSKLRTQQVGSIWLDSRYSNTEYGTKLIQSILCDINPFEYPKSVYTLRDVLYLTTQKDSVVLDFFAGSGTTGHAVLMLNNEDGGNRKFILCTNNENGICEKVTYSRIKNVIIGYTDIKGEYHDGIGGNVKYYKVGFVEKSMSEDISKNNFIGKCNDLICLKEGIFNEIESGRDCYIYSSRNKYLVIYYGYGLDDESLKPLKNKLDKLNGEKILYCYTLNPFGINMNEFKNWKNVRVESIPQKILDVYENIGWAVS